MGVEAGNPDIRRRVLRRNISNHQLIEVFQIAKDFGLKPQSFNMIGLPGETFENMLETIQLNAAIKPYIVWLSTFIPYPGTELYRECRKHHMIDEAKWDQVHSYRGDSILKEEFLPFLPFRKLRLMFLWLLNARLNGQTKDIYQPAIDQLSALPDEQWRNGSVEKLYAEKADEIDRILRERDISHYVKKKYINIFWGKEYDYDLT
jgi:radical SAM superfamily enzyme YgiQ (UPF0313 family)